MRLTLILSAVLALACSAANAQQATPAQAQQAPTAEMRAAAKMVSDASDREFVALVHLGNAQDAIVRLNTQLKAAEDKLAAAEKATTGTEPAAAPSDKKEP
jgi:hypothetical protein